MSLARLPIALAVGAIVAFLAWSSRPAPSEHFPFLFPLLGLGLTAAGVGAKVTGVDKKVQDAIWKPKAPKYAVTYQGREWNGYDWSCPAGTVETGSTDNTKACITSQFHPPVWKPAADGTWGHNCPAGTVPTPEQEWEKKCEVGYTGRVQSGAAWICPGGTTDTGNSWEKNTWHDAHKQCKRSVPYTQRIQAGDKWVCPPDTKDTGLSWDAAQHGEKQCKWTGP